MDEPESRPSEGPEGGGEEEASTLRERGEEALGELGQALLENPLLSQALGKALHAGERAAQAQRNAIGALNLASSFDLERLEQRLRSLSSRLEAVEDQLDELARERPRGGAG
ncbi:MAG TPA: hypothetical protein VK919_05900 [Solirubrobacterales bacterium]|nr:hypothetical protein [Solirubrobacterales bacterium]